jgi:pimeloyl-ACP methyl ester carboxylesterase
MPQATIRGVEINYEVLGERGPWVALQPGGRRGLEGVKSLGQKLAESGHRVLVYDRRNCGASGISFDGGNSENEAWAEDLHALLLQLDAAPAFIGGSSSGCRLALLAALVQNYYTQFIESAEHGGMEAVCRTEHFSELIASNPANRVRLMSMGGEQFIAVMKAWRRSFDEGADHPVIGISPAELRSMTMPACIIPGNDRTHPREPGQVAHRLMPNAEYHEVVTEDRPDLDVALEDWNAKEGLLAAIFIDFLRRAQRRA